MNKRPRVQALSRKRAVSVYKGSEVEKPVVFPESSLGRNNGGFVSGVSEKSGCLLALAGFLVGEGPVWSREVGGRDTGQGCPGPAAPAHPGEAQDSFSVDWWAAARLEPNCFLLKTIFCFVGMMVSSV